MNLTPVRPTPAQFEEILALAAEGTIMTDLGLDTETIDALDALAGAPADLHEILIRAARRAFAGN